MDVAVEGLRKSCSEGVVTAADCAEPVGAWELLDSRSGVWGASALVSLTCAWGISRFNGRSCTFGMIGAKKPCAALPGSNCCWTNVQMKVVEAVILIIALQGQAWTVASLANSEI